MHIQKRLGEDSYIKPEFTEQSIISSDIDEMKNKLNNFIRVEESFFENIPCGIWVKYVSKAEGLYRSGGILIKNASPTYLILKNISKNLTWSVDLKKNYIYMQNIKEKEELNLRKDNLYKLYEAGFIEILDQPKNIEN